MRRKHLIAAGLFLLGSLLVPLKAESQQRSPFDEIYVFGDSLSDMGNVFKVTNEQAPPSPPYFDGRYSNGPVWVEYLAQELGLTAGSLNNFAFGGATTGTSNASSTAAWIGLQQQVNRFKSSTTAADPAALYIVWAGANDYLSGSFTDSTPAIANLSNAITQLQSAGAKNIIVGNLPDLGDLPLTRNTERSTALTQLTEQHNAQLDALLGTLRQRFGSQVTLTLLDVNTLFKAAMTNPREYGFSNVMDACLATRCPEPNGYLFWDQIHPTTAAHQQLANLAANQLRSPSLTSDRSLNPAVVGGMLAIGAVASIVLLKVRTTA